VVAALTAGMVVALPTDTVYGVGALVAIPSAVRQLFTLKRRPETVALPVLVADIADVRRLAMSLSEREIRMMEALWPGPLTMVISTSNALASIVGGVDEVGFRIPNSPALRELLRRTGPVAMTSANEHGEAPCNTAEQVAAVFAGRQELRGVWNRGERRGEVSTVLRVTDDGVEILREGALSRETVLSVL